MVYEYQLRLLPEQAADEERISAYLVAEKGLRRDGLQAVRIVRRSIDARRRPVYVNLSVRAFVDEMPDEDFPLTQYGDVSSRRPVVVVGAGPAGLFAALKLIELGRRPIVIERGKDVHSRRKDVARIPHEQKINPESNYCFGEGGAGAFSDGKLYTRSHKRGDTTHVLNVLCQHGASTSILYDAHPHIGTDRLPRVIERMRQTICQCGGYVQFETKMTDLVLNGGRVVGVVTADGREFMGPVILATGHSAGDVYRSLLARGVEMEPKGVAVGVRLEHPSALIDQLQYHTREGRGRYLPPATYSFVTQVAGRGVYSFCMCPGGFVVPAAACEESLSVNGMSPSNRGGRWSNAGMVVELHPEDLGPTAGEGALSMLTFVEGLERTCYLQAGGRQTAPAQRMTDFVEGKLSYDLPSSSYAPGLLSSPLHFWLPPFVSDRLREGFRHFGRSSRGFLTREATVIGVETRTSSPIRINRLPDTLHHIRLRGLYPCGEGAGYAGGIVSAAVDGERCAIAAANEDE